MERRILLARVLAITASACGAIGLIAGLIGRGWKLGVTGWFTGGTLLAVLALVALAEQYFASRRNGPG